MDQYSAIARLVDPTVLQMLAVDPMLGKSFWEWLCESLKRDFDNIPKFKYRISINLGGVTEFPFMEEWEGLPGGEDIPNVYVDPDQETGLVVSTPMLNPAWVALLNDGLALGCEWAVEAAASLSDWLLRQKR